MIKAASKAARGIARDFTEVAKLEISKKGAADFVTASDLRAEKIIFEELNAAKPGYSFLMEERGEVKGDDPDHRWIVDPLDGTINFIHGYANFCISIALEKKSDIIAGVIYDPINRELFFAERGKGAFLEDRDGKTHRLRISTIKELSNALAVCGSLKIGGDKNRVLVDKMIPHIASLRCTGSAALNMAYVAAGRFDLFFQHQINAWDIAAGVILVREAGGVVTEIDGGDNFLTKNNILATNNILQKQIFNL